MSNVNLHINTCRISGVEFIADFQAGKYAIHPMMALPYDEVRSSILQLEDCKNILSFDASRSAILLTLLAKLRIASLQLAKYKGFLAEDFTADTVPSAHRREATLYLRSTFEGVDTESELGFKFAVEQIKTEALAVRILADSYTEGFPKIAQLYFGCWGALVQACFERCEEYEQLATTAGMLQSDIVYANINARVIYETLQRKSVNSAEFIKAAKSLLRDALVPENALTECAHYLYKSYFKVLVKKSEGKFRLNNEDEVAKQFAHDLARLDAELLEVFTNKIPKVLEGKAGRLLSMLKLQPATWNIKPALMAALHELIDNDSRYAVQARRINTTLPTLDLFADLKSA